MLLRKQALTNFQFLKASVPISMTEAGISIEIKLLQPLKA